MRLLLKSLKKQLIVTLPTREVEYIALNSCVTKIIWLKHPIVSYCINETSFIP